MTVSENDLFFTLGSGTSSAQNENLWPLLNTNIPLISGKYGLRNHFWPLEVESRFLMRKIEKTRFSQNLFISGFWSFGFLIYTLSGANLKKNTVIHFFSQSMFPILVTDKEQIFLPDALSYSSAFSAVAATFSSSRSSPTYKAILKSWLLNEFSFDQSPLAIRFTW